MRNHAVKMNISTVVISYCYWSCSWDVAELDDTPSHSERKTYYSPFWGKNAQLSSFYMLKTFIFLCRRLNIRKVTMNAKQSTHPWLILQKWIWPRKTLPIEVM